MTSTTFDDGTRFRIGDWIIRSDLNTAERGAEVCRLEARAVAVLAYLHRNRDRVVSKSELLDAVWQRSAISDHSVAVVISDLRRALGDDSRAPRYIRTVPRRGYALIAPCDGDADTNDALWDDPALDTEAASVSGQSKSRPSRWLMAGAAALVVLIAASGIWIAWDPGDAGVRDAGEPLSRRPFTTFEGRAVHPAYSPDGTQVAFAWNQDDGFAFDLYLMPDQGYELTRLTDMEGYESNPAFSPDGERIAFLHRHWDSAGIECGAYVMPAAGGEPHRIGNCASNTMIALSWLPDGRHVVFPAFDETTGQSYLARVDTQTLDHVAITAPPSRTAGDNLAAVSPDGRTLAFSRIVRGFLNDLYVLPLDEDGLPAGPVRQLTRDASAITDIDWTPDGERILFTSSRSGPFSVWKIAPDGGAPVEAVRTSAFVYGVAVSPDGRSMVLDQRDEAANIALMPILPPGMSGAPDAVTAFKRGPQEPVFVTHSTRFEFAAAFSADGTRIAFVSDRTGASEIWVASADGTNLRQITNLDGPAIEFPRWSPDGQTILFAAVLDGAADLFEVPVTGGPLRRLTDDGARDFGAVWSADGATVYFISDRTGRSEAWSLDRGTGALAQITQSGADAVRVGTDGRMLYIAGDAQPGLYAHDIAGDRPPRRLTPPGVGLGKAHWTVVGDHLYYLGPGDTIDTALRRIDFDTMLTDGFETAKAVFEFDGGPYGRIFDVSPDETHVLYAAVSRYHGQLYKVDAEP